MFELKFETANAAFEEGALEFEVSRILQVVEHQVAQGFTGGYVRDVNGNRVGEWSLA